MPRRVSGLPLMASVGPLAVPWARSSDRSSPVPAPWSAHLSERRLALEPAEMSTLLMGAGMGLMVAISLAFILAFNMSRLRWLMDHDIHPLLEEHGLREPDDGFTSSGAKERMAAFHSDVAEARAAPEREREARERRRFTVFDPTVDKLPLPAGPYPFDRPTASWARDIYEEGDWAYADAWVRGGGGSHAWCASNATTRGATKSSPATA